MTNKKKLKLIESIRSIWSSLDSHLDLTVKQNKDKVFHIKTTKEYAQDLKNLCELL